MKIINIRLNDWHLIGWIITVSYIDYKECIGLEYYFNNGFYKVMPYTYITYD